MLRKRKSGKQLNVALPHMHVLFIQPKLNIPARTENLLLHWAKFDLSDTTGYIHTPLTN